MPGQASAHQSTFNYILIKGGGSLKNERIFLNQELAIKRAVSDPVEGTSPARLAAPASGGKGAHSDPVHGYAGGTAGRFPPPHRLSLNRLSGCREKRFPSLSKKPLICSFSPCYLHNTTTRWSGLFLCIWGKFSYGFFARSFLFGISKRMGGGTFSVKVT